MLELKDLPGVNPICLRDHSFVMCKIRSKSRAANDLPGEKIRRDDITKKLDGTILNTA